MKLLKKTYEKEVYYELHHNIDAYRKSLYIETFEKYKSVFEKTRHNKFRTSEDIQRIIFGLDLVFSYSAKLVVRKRMTLLDRYFLYLFRSCSCFDYRGLDDDKTFKRVKKFKPKLFCLNCGDDNSAEAKAKAKAHMEQMFPKPSKFEI